MFATPLGSSYVRCKFAGNKKNTKIARKTYDPHWNEQLAMPYTAPTMTDAIVVEAFDYERGAIDEWIGRATFSLKVDNIRGACVIDGV